MIGSTATPKTLAEMFAFACAAYARERNDDLFSTWQASLGHESVPELYEAFIAHQRNTTLDVRDGRPVGRWFPTVADLLMHVEANRRAEIAKRPPRPCCGRNDCFSGWILVQNGAARCPHCKELWNARV